ncbi:MAG: thioredoxin family protein [Alicyclobacillus sp.]|nr:thioredoxin family protein [Alicyclobacillus sp.]
MTVASVTSLDEYFTLVRGADPVVMVFSADWCPDCRYLDGFLADVAAARPQFAFYKVDRDAFPELCESLDILGIPSLLAYQHGRVLGRFVSKLRKTRAEVEAFLDDVAQRLPAAP